MAIQVDTCSVTHGGKRLTSVKEDHPDTSECDMMLTLIYQCDTWWPRYTSVTDDDPDTPVWRMVTQIHQCGTWWPRYTSVTDDDPDTPVWRMVTQIHQCDAWWPRYTSVTDDDPDTPVWHKTTQLQIHQSVTHDDPNTPVWRMTTHDDPTGSQCDTWRPQFTSVTHDDPSEPVWNKTTVWHRTTRINHSVTHDDPVDHSVTHDDPSRPQCDTWQPRLTTVVNPDSHSKFPKLLMPCKIHLNYVSWDEFVLKKTAGFILSGLC